MAKCNEELLSGLGTEVLTRQAAIFFKGAIYSKTDCVSLNALISEAVRQVK
jgi:hypothetical protein